MRVVIVVAFIVSELHGGVGVGVHNMFILDQAMDEIAVVVDEVFRLRVEVGNVIKDVSFMPDPSLVLKVFKTLLVDDSLVHDIVIVIADVDGVSLEDVQVFIVSIGVVVDDGYLLV